MQHIEAYDNKNKPIVDIDNNIVPLVYFNHIKLNKGCYAIKGKFLNGIDIFE